MSLNESIDDTKTAIIKRTRSIFFGNALAALKNTATTQVSTASSHIFRVYNNQKNGRNLQNIQMCTRNDERKERKVSATALHFFK